MIVKAVTRVTGPDLLAEAARWVADVATYSGVVYSGDLSTVMTLAVRQLRPELADRSVRVLVDEAKDMFAGYLVSQGEVDEGEDPGRELVGWFDRLPGGRSIRQVSHLLAAAANRFRFEFRQEVLA